jgi:hypothetical protein
VAQVAIRIRFVDAVSERGAAIFCGAAAAGTGLVSALASQDGWLRSSALVHMAADEPIAALARATDPHFSFVTDVEHYDGVYFYAIARDPFARGAAHELIDQAPYRYGHPLHGWLAGLLSLGQASAVPAALVVLSLAGMAIAAWSLSRLCSLAGASPWLGLVVAVVPGLLYATTVSTSETVGAALVLSALLSWQLERWTLGAVLIAMCCFDKEPFVVIPVGLAVWEFAQWRRNGKPTRWGRRMLALSVGPLLFALWLGYVHATLHHWPTSGQQGNLAAPVAGWRQTMTYAHNLAGGSFEQSQIGATTPPLLIALAALLLFAAAVALRLRTVADAPLLGLVAITACQGWLTLLYPHEIFRTPAVATVVALLVLLTSRRRDASAAQERELADRTLGGRSERGYVRAVAENLTRHTRQDEPGGVAEDAAHIVGGTPLGADSRHQERPAQLVEVDPGVASRRADDDAE